MRYQAHRGVATEAPENTMAAYRLAVLQGYDVIELDPSFTKDGVCVLFHDKTLARTCRTDDGGSVSPDRLLSDTAFADLLTWACPTPSNIGESGCLLWRTHWRSQKSRAS